MGPYGPAVDRWAAILGRAAPVQRDARVRIRVWVTLAAVIAVVVAGWWWWHLATAAPVEAAGWCSGHAGCVPGMAGPPWSQTALVWGIAAAVVAVLGIIGRPADSPLIDRAVVAAKVEKLTSDVVVRALGPIGIAAINQAIAKMPKAAIEFRAPIMRDGPGWLAMLDLPYGVTVALVMDKRRELASGPPAGRDRRSRSAC